MFKILLILLRKFWKHVKVNYVSNLPDSFILDFLFKVIVLEIMGYYNQKHSNQQSFLPDMQYITTKNKKANLFSYIFLFQVNYLQWKTYLEPEHHFAKMSSYMKKRLAHRFFAYHTSEGTGIYKLILE